MGSPYPANEKQLLIYKEIGRSNQAWTVMIFVLAIVALLTVAFLYCIFGHQTPTPTAISGLLDGLFGWCLRAIISFHFPQIEKKEGSS
jgi:hypothetical protein